jgi:hypothetical protein
MGSSSYLLSKSLSSLGCYDAFLSGCNLLPFAIPPGQSPNLNDSIFTFARDVPVSHTEKYLPKYKRFQSVADTIKRYSEKPGACRIQKPTFRMEILYGLGGINCPIDWRRGQIIGICLPFVPPVNAKVALIYGYNDITRIKLTDTDQAQIRQVKFANRQPQHRTKIK